MSTSVMRQDVVEATPQLKEKLDTISSDIQNMNADMNTGFTAANQYLSNIYARQTTVQTAITNAIAAQTTAINAKLDTLISLMQENNTLLEDIKTNTTP